MVERDRPFNMVSEAPKNLYFKFMVISKSGFFLCDFRGITCFENLRYLEFLGQFCWVFRKFCLSFRFFWKNWLSFCQKSLSFWQISDQMLGFVAKLTLFSSENCIFKQFQGKTQLFLEFLMLCLLSFEQMALKTSGSLSFWAGNTLSFFRAWVFFTLSFSKTHKKSLSY